MAGALNSTTMPRRTFLGGLATLPLIGGGVTILSNPTKAAVPITDDLLGRYEEFLFFERRMLLMERYPDREERRFREGFYPAPRPSAGLRAEFHFPGGHIDRWVDVPTPSTRAALVLSTVGADIGVTP
jgi:hypothetical protein